MKSKIRPILSYILLFSIVFSLLFGALVLVSLIPKSAIKTNIYESAQFFVEEEIFDEKVEGVKGSTLDRYADTILVAIAYQYDEEHPVSSVVWSSYYHDDMKNENDNLMKAVSEELEPNQQYLRYWHGSNIILRPLLLVFNISQIYVLNVVVIGVLVLALLFIFIGKKAYTPAAGVGVGLVLTSSWFVPFSLEYVWTYGVMLIMSIIGVNLAYKGKWHYIGAFFMLGGMVTNYLDFLSTETITLTVPLLLLLWIKDHKKECLSPKDGLVFVGRNVLLWGVGYVGMWIGKWILATALIGENVMPYVTEHIGERLAGDIGLNPIQYIFGAVWRNICCLFPFEYGVTGAFLGVALVVFALFVGYVYYGKKEDKKMILVYVLIGLIPYVRYMVLHNHAYLHCFFTFRAQIATVLALVFVLELLTDRRWFSRGRNKKKRA